MVGKGHFRFLERSSTLCLRLKKLKVVNSFRNVGCKKLILNATSNYKTLANMFFMQMKLVCCLNIIKHNNLQEFPRQIIEN